MQNLGGALTAYHRGQVSLGTVLSVFFSLNLLLAVFNLLPLPPLDGSGALPLFMSPEAAEGVRVG